MERAIRSSFLAGMPEHALDALRQHALVLELPRASVLYRSGDAPRFAVVADGLVRVSVGEPGGTREITVRYARPGDALGVTLLNGPPPLWLEVGAQTLEASRLVFFDIRTLRAEAGAHARVARLLSEEASRVAHLLLEELSRVAFTSIRERLARHLLALASPGRPAQPPAAQVTHQELADAVGTVRQVVTRTLEEWRRQGLVSTERGQVRLLDSDRLLELLSSDTRVAAAPRRIGDSSLAT